MQQNKNQVNSIILNVFVSVVYSKDRKATTAWKISKYGVFSSPYFPALGLNSIANDANHSLNDLRYIYHSLKFFFEETKFLAFRLFHFMIQTISYIINLQPYSGHISVKSKWKACWEKKHISRTFAWGIIEGWSYLPRSLWYSTNKNWVWNKVNQKI